MDPLRNIPRLADLSGHLQQLPITDRGAFAILTSIPDIQAWIAAKADEYRRFALALLAIHNLTAPIHRLPTEVLERVFQNCWQDWSSLRLPHVCRLWRSIFLDRPEFWADAVSKCELQEKREVAPRSELPLIDFLLSRSTQHSHAIDPRFQIFPSTVAQVVTPYSGNIASLHVYVDSQDLRDGLWAVLLSGMPSLETLTIGITITGEHLNECRTREYINLQESRHSLAWNKLPMLSRDALPRLSRLTCPHSMVGRFSDVPLRHLKAEVMVMRPPLPPQRSFALYLPGILLGGREGLHLRPHRSRLETLEIMQTSIHKEEPLEPLDLSSLRHLRIDIDGDNAVTDILSWLQLPQATFVHITEFYAFSPLLDHGTSLRSVVSTIDRVCLQLLDLEWTPGMHQYRMQCFVDGIERLRIDNLVVNQTTFPLVLGDNAPVTHLELSTVNFSRVMDSFDLHAFPHLVHLNMNQSDMEAMGVLLQPDLNPRRRGLRAVGSPVPDDTTLSNLKLTELVISCPPPDFDRRYPIPGRVDPLDTDTNMPFGTKVDELFREQCTVFQQALTDRAARGSRLTYLAISLRPAVPDGSHSVDTDTDSDSGSNPESQDEELEADAERREEVREVDCGGGPDINLSGSSNETAEHKEPVNPCAFWPSHAVRREVLESLRELVDGPVILKLLDDAGDEISVEEA